MPIPISVLGIARGTPFLEAQRIWRDLVKENHPDRLEARGVPKEFLAIADERIRAINAAWNILSPELKRAALVQSDHRGAESAAVAEFWRAQGRQGRQRPHPALYRHEDRRRARKTGCALTKARFRRIISSMRTGTSCRWCARRTGPGMRARASGRASGILNSVSIGIEIVNPGHHGYTDFPDAQICGCDQALPGHHPAPQDCARNGAGAFGHCAGKKS